MRLAKLETRIDEEIAAWVDDYKPGLRDLELADPSLVAERVPQPGRLRPAQVRKQG